MKKIVVGILAHVDSGKTSLSESLLYHSGAIKNIGRVDHKNAFLDTYDLEKDRGITIFSKQAVFEYNNTSFTLLDTPGHIDFSTEMERTLSVLDYAILVISGTDGVQSHTKTLWQLLKHYNIPTFIFVNKMDLPTANKDNILNELHDNLDDKCIDFCFYQDSDSFYENIAMCSNSLFDEYIDSGRISDSAISEHIRLREIFPCFFGSALKLEGTEFFLQSIDKFTLQPQYSDTFGARVFKISYDNQNSRLTFVKITGGSLKVKSILDSKTNEKCNQIRIYSGAKYILADEVFPGTICALTGLSSTKSGDVFGNEPPTKSAVIEPIMSYKIILPKGCDEHSALKQLKQLEDEDPQLGIKWNENLKEINVLIMGEVQLEILKNIAQNRFDLDIEFSTGSILYKETISNTVEGVGHYEPLKHYSEVHLLLEPLERGCGIILESVCKEDVLDRNWQRLVLTHLAEKEHLGVLTGSPITDIKITLLSGRAHIKHTEGGDFRQASYRAVRQGLMQAESVLLEPYYSFTITVPSENVGRAMTDIGQMGGTFSPPVTDKDMSILSGTVPVASINGYSNELYSYTKGRGKILCIFDGYDICHNPDEVINSINYDCERDTDNPSSSVFCFHGAGTVVNWNEVFNHMHIERCYKPDNQLSQELLTSSKTYNSKSNSERSTGFYDKELEEIMIREFGSMQSRLPASYQNSVSPKSSKEYVYKEKTKSDKPNYLLVDGYNVIYAWDELSELAKINLESARTKLMDILCNYQGFKHNNIILVFDAYKVKGNPGEIINYNNIHIVYTKEAETADMYIEKVTHDIAKKCNVTVATSDGLEQMIVIGQGANRISSRELLEEINATVKQSLSDYKSSAKHDRFSIEDKVYNAINEHQK